MYSDFAFTLTGKPYYVAYSGGKDSDTIRILCELANVPYELYHNHTTVDAPETVYYIRSIPNIIISYPEKTMWDLIVEKHMPPLRQARYCCSILKEHGGENRFVITGVRWAESWSRRKNRAGLEIQTRNRSDGLILNADNDESRQLFETCQLKGKRILNPIVDWSESDVWEFLHHYDCRSNPLYECGFKRIGCIGCPMGGHPEIEFQRWPKYKKIYIHTFDRMLKARPIGKTTRYWTSGEAVFNWWIKTRTKQYPRYNADQLSLDY